MKYGVLGQTGLKISRLILGGGHFGSVFKNIGRKEAFRLIDFSLDQGVTFVDTSPIYGQGYSEEWLGESLRHHRNKVSIATKVGYHLSSVARWSRPLNACFRGALRSRAARDFLRPFREGELSRLKFSLEIEKSVNASLRRLRVDRIDLLHLHDPFPLDPFEAYFEVFERLQKQGKVGHLGLALSTPPSAIPPCSLERFDVIQIAPEALATHSHESIHAFVHSGKGVLLRSAFDGGKAFASERKQVSDFEIISSTFDKIFSGPRVDGVVVGPRNCPQLKSLVRYFSGNSSDL